MRLNKKEFCSAVKLYQRMYDEESYIIDALGIVPEWKPSEWLTAYYNFLSDMCDFDENEYENPGGTALDYYCFELDFGRKWRPGMVTVNGSYVKLQTPEDLWSYLNL